MAELSKGRGQALRSRASAVADLARRVWQRGHGAAHGFARPGNDGGVRQGSRRRRQATKDAPGRSAADYGLWVGSFIRGDLPAMRAHAAAFLSDLEARPDSPGGRRGPPHSSELLAGSPASIAKALDHLERALALFQPGRDDDLASASDQTLASRVMAHLGDSVSWSLGEVDRAISFNDRMQTRMADLTNVSTLAVGTQNAAMFELMRGDATRAAPNAFELARLARERELPMWRRFRRVSKGLGDLCDRRNRRGARGHAPRR